MYITLIVPQENILWELWNFAMELLDLVVYSGADPGGRPRGLDPPPPLKFNF